MVKVVGKAPKGPSRVTSMKVITRTTRSRVTACSLGQVGTPIRESTRKTKEMVSVKCAGQMEVCTRETGIEAFSMATER
jgi:hypothetical protein